jgi:hypothetical protein
MHVICRLGRGLMAIILSDKYVLWHREKNIWDGCQYATPMGSPTTTNRAFDEIQWSTKAGTAP